MMKSQKRILQITAAHPGWMAKFIRQDGSIDVEPVAVWALVEEDGFQYLASFTGDAIEIGGTDDEVSNFAGWRLSTPEEWAEWPIEVPRP